MPNSQSSIKAIKMIIIIITIAIVGFGAIYYFSNKSYLDKTPKSLSEEEKREKMIKRQVAELERLRKESDIKPLAKEDIKKQAAELEKMRKNSGVKPATQEQIAKQIEEMNKMKSQSNFSEF